MSGAAKRYDLLISSVSNWQCLAQTRKLVLLRMDDMYFLAVPMKSKVTVKLDAATPVGPTA